MKAIGSILVILLFPFLVIGQSDDFPDANFQRADSIAELYRNASIVDLPHLSLSLTKDLNLDVEKFRAIHTWVCQNIKNDYGFFKENQRKRHSLLSKPKKLAAWNNTFNKRMFKALREGNRTVCTGYAYLIKEMAYFVGLPCEIIDGYGRTANSNVEKLGIANHSWNAVQLSGKWYLCDATWSAGSFYLFSGLKVFAQDYNNGFFLCAPERFIYNHLPLDLKWTLLSRDYDAQSFHLTPLVYNQVFKYGIESISPFVLYVEKKEGDSLIVSFSSAEVIAAEKLYFEAFQYSNSFIIEPNRYFYKAGRHHLVIKKLQKGNFDLHLKYGDNYLLSYLMKVKKS